MINCENLVKIYRTSTLEVVALQGLDLVVEKGELMAIIGSSGSGKSTLMNMIGGLDSPSAGKLLVDGNDMTKMTERDLIRYKRETVGFVWQNNAKNLVPYFTALENIELPMHFSGNRSRNRALELLDAVGLTHRCGNKLTELSGGEQQRVAIALALANEPKILLADEPTGSVDSHTSDMILDLFRKLNRERGLTIVIVTHDMKLYRKVDRVVAIRDGKTSTEIVRKKINLEDIELNEDTTLQSDTEDSHEEYVLMDEAGRIQLPAGWVDKTGLRKTKRVRLEQVEEGLLLKSSEP